MGEESPCEKVFQLKELRETILSYAIYKDNGRSLSGFNVSSCRHVQWAWFHSTSKCVRNARKPLIQFNLPEDIVAADKSLTTFIEHATQPSRLERDIFPPFSIMANADFCRFENYPILLDLLTKCEDGLVELGLTFPRDGGSVLFIFPKLCLHRLTRFSVELCEDNLNSPTEADIVGNNFQALNFAQTILNESQDLKAFVMECDIFNRLPPSFPLLSLPPTLGKIELACPLSTGDLEVLTRNPLPKLEHLFLQLPDVPWDNGVVFSVLQKVRKTLKSLFFTSSYLEHEGGPVPLTFTLSTFPLMERLEKFGNFGLHFSLEGNPVALQDKLPILQTLVLFLETREGFRQWTTNSRFPWVKRFRMNLVDVNFAETDVNYVVSVDVETMQLLHTTFPNLTELAITVTGSEMDALKYLFLELQGLTSLKIVVWNTSGVVNSDHWDAILIGVPADFVTGLRTHPDMWELIELKNDGRPSITNLTKLKSLDLETRRENHLPRELRDVPLISNVAFHFGFLKMPKLECLKFEGRFLISNEMKEKWRELNRVEEYLPVEDNDESDAEDNQQVHDPEQDAENIMPMPDAAQ